jgi:3-oxoacyl-[acyl-carrier protein] reductase
MDLEIAGQVAVVTGGSKGIGLAVARTLAAEGVKVVVGARGVDQMPAIEGVDALALDLVASDGPQRLVAHAQELHGADVDILVNNVGGFDEPVFPDASVAHWSGALDLNLRSAMLGIHFAARAMEKRGGGAIVNIASTAGLGFAPHPSPEYAATKAALMRLTACLGPLAERGIRVNCVCPYTVGTAAVRRTIAESVAEGRELPPPLLATLLEPEEVADALVRLVQDESLAGRVLVLRGGEPPRLLPAED